MRLRSRFEQELRARMLAVMPEATETAWDETAVVIVIEQIKVSPSGGYQEDWQRMASFTGILRAELRSDRVDQSPYEDLIADLQSQPLLVKPADADRTETARAKLIELRDTIRDTDVATALRFELEGVILHRGSDVVIPDPTFTGPHGEVIRP